MRIRDEQVTVLASARREDFRHRVIEYIRRSKESAANLTDVELEQRVDAALAQAALYGIRREDTLAVFVSLTFSLSRRFYEPPAVSRVMNDPDLPPDVRIRALLTELSVDELASLNPENK